MMASGSSGLVVWEWMGDNGKWVPYKPKICRELENARSLGMQSTVDITIRSENCRLSLRIDVKRMIQINMIKNHTRHVQRRNLPSESLLAKQYMWTWDIGAPFSPLWTPYSSELMEEIEKEYQNNSRWFDLRSFGLPYRLNFTNNTQENVKTHFSRGIKRRLLRCSYPSDSGAISTLSSQHSTPQHSMPRHYAAHLEGPVYGHQLSHPGVAVPYPTQPHGPARGHQQQTLTYGHNQGHLQSQPGMAGNGALSSMPPLAQHNKTPSKPPPAQSTSSLMSVPSSKPEPRPPTSNATKRKTVHLRPCDKNEIPSPKSTPVPVSEVLKNFTKPSQVDASCTDQCPICQTNLTDESGFGNSKETCELSLCEHIFHRQCIGATYSRGAQSGYIVCPSCTKMHGIMIGNQPPGVMRYTTSLSSLPGNPGCGTLRIIYNIQPGVQTLEHLHPGRRFQTPGFPRIAYLPDSDKGRQVLFLLIEAWKRRLIFTVGQSNTLGQDDVVTWAAIYHKTEKDQYPDPYYFETVLDDLKAAGVVDALFQI